MQKSELEKEMLTKIRSEPDGKKVCTDVVVVTLLYQQDDGNDEVDSSSTVKPKPCKLTQINVNCLF